MGKVSAIKYFSIAVYIFFLLAELASSAPCSSNFDNNEELENYRGQDYQIKKNRSLDVRDLYELLLKKQTLDGQLNQPNRQIVRKSNRSPSLRLRFGKRGEPYPVNPKSMGDSYQFLEVLDN